MFKQNLKKLIAGTLSLVMLASAVTICPSKVVAAATYVSSPGRVSVHDPSIFKDTDGTYYVFGSHLSDAKSTNLINWTQINSDWNARWGTDWKSDSIYSGSVGNVLTNLAESFKWAGYDDGDCSGNSLAVWAPDVIYNENYEWSDGTKGAYMLYYSASSTWRRSCIGYAVSKKVSGPYDYVDTVIYSGFTKDGRTDGESTRNTKWSNNYLNLSKLISAGTISDISSKWFDGDDWNANYAPNAIDPTVFYDKDGKMYMVYGSWSGGLFILELDAKTGAVKYPGKDSTDSTSGNFTDRYFGTHIAGGNHQSGEGPYILYDKETDYYYLYETYGGLLADQGYNMRLFRSKNVYGPYLDAKGNNAKNSNSNNDNYGIKLIGNYRFNNQSGYRAAGHNSALIDDDGQRYLFYHQRFTTDLYSHQLRVRRQFLNEDDWPVETVYEYRDTDEKIEHYTDTDISGTYEIINHGTATNGSMISSLTAVLQPNGTVSGDITGTWTKKDSGKGYDYVTITIGTTTYKGFFLKQYSELSTTEKVMTFSTIGNNNCCLWGSKTGDSVADSNETPDKNTVTAVSTDAEKNVTSDDSDSGSATTVSVKKAALKSVKKATLKSVKKATLKSVKSKKKKQIVVTWKKISGVKGYQIQYATKKNFKNKKTITIKNAKTVKKTIKKLKSKKKYYVRVRAYKTSSGSKIYGKWSSAKSTTVK
jgi:arabinan endo-1,5-alpha-L-arabinosidase